MRVSLAMFACWLAFLILAAFSFDVWGVIVVAAVGLALSIFQ